MTIAILSKDPLLNVLSFLDDPRDLARACQVNKNWKLLCETESFWKRFFPQDYAEDLSIRALFQQKKVVSFGDEILSRFEDFLSKYYKANAEFICEFPFQKLMHLKIKIENLSKPGIAHIEKIYCLKKCTLEELSELELTEWPIWREGIYATFQFQVIKGFNPRRFATPLVNNTAP